MFTFFRITSDESAHDLNFKPEADLIVSVAIPRYFVTTKAEKADSGQEQNVEVEMITEQMSPANQTAEGRL